MTADSSPSTVQQTTSSAESNFRELDDAYLQTQARIWIGEVLQIRFDEQVDISDLLADGELLFEVAEVVSRMVPFLSVDETQLKVHEWKTLASNKSTRRYMPYYNVDSFLRMCKNLGMDGIDLFPPADVVERRSTRKVCMCLRSLSKLSRLRDLNVPDFDSVTCILAMPTDMVECIRKSLEMSQSSSSLSVEQEAEKARVRFWRRMSNSASAVSNGYSDNSDEAESKFVIPESYGSSHFAYGVESPNISGSQLVRGHNSAPQLSMISEFNDADDDQCEYLSPSKAESVGSPCSEYYGDEELNLASSNCPGSRISGKVPELNSDNKNGYLSDASHIPVDWGTSHLDIESFTNDDAVCCVSCNKDVNTTCSHDIYPNQNDICNEYLATSNNPSGVDCDKSSALAGPPEFVVTDDFYAAEGPKLSHEDVPLNNNEAKHDFLVWEVGPHDGEPNSDEKTSSWFFSSDQIIQSSCVSKPSEKSDFLCNYEYQVPTACKEVIYGRNSCCDRLKIGKITSEDAGDQLRFDEEQPPFSVDYDVHCCNCSSSLAVRSNGNDGYLGNKENALSDMPYMDDLNSSIDMAVAKNNIKSSKDCHDAMKVSEGHHDLVESVDDKGDSGHVKEEAINEETPAHKPQRKLLKSFVKGTAVLGVAVFLVHLRKNRRENLSKAKKQPTQIVLQGTPKSSQKGGNTSSVYPAENLRLGI